MDTQPLPALSPKNSRSFGWVAGISIFIIVLVTVPYIFAIYMAGPDQVFNGFLFNPFDGNSYLAKMYEGWRGDWRFTPPHTAEPGKGAYLFLFYLFLGHVARGSGLSLLLTFHLARLAAVVLLLISLYHFFVKVLPDERAAVRAFILAVLGTGLGWLALLFKVYTADFWVADAYPFLAMYTMPHFSVGLALLLALLSRGLNRSRPDHFVNGLVLTLMGLGLAIVMPFGLVIVTSVLCWFALLRMLPVWPPGPALKRFFAEVGPQVIAILLFGGPYLLYQLWSIHTDPILANWNLQNLEPTPAWWNLLISFSPAFLLAIPGSWAAFCRKSRGDQILLAWVWPGLVLIYLPWNLQRRFMEGMYIPLAGLAVLGLDFLQTHRSRLGRLAPYGFLLTLPTLLVFILAGLYGVVMRDASVYLERDEVQALDWLRRYTPEHALVLAGPQSGMRIPAYTGRRVLYGHPYETVHAEERQAAVQAFFRSGGRDAAFLKLNRIDYILYGVSEAELGPPPSASGLHIVFQAGKFSIFQVSH